MRYRLTLADKFLYPGKPEPRTLAVIELDLLTPKRIRQALVAAGLVEKGARLLIDVWGDGAVQIRNHGQEFWLDGIMSNGCGVYSLVYPSRAAEKPVNPPPAFAGCPSTPRKLEAPSWPPQ